MRLSWYEFIRTVRKNPALFFLNLIGILSVLLITAFSVSYYLDKKEVKNSLSESYQGRNFYKIVYDGEIEDLYEKVFRSDSILNVKKAFEELNSQSLFEYSYSQPDCVTVIDARKHIWKPEVMYGYEEGNIDEEYLVIKSVYADRKFFHNNGVVIQNGKAFEKEDYLVTDKNNVCFPVLLGNEYREDFQKGEEIVVNMWDETRVTLVVAGFLKAGSYYYDNNNEKIILDRYLILPDAEVGYEIKGNVLEDSFFLGTYDGIKLMNARVICNQKDKKKVKEKVNEILNKYQLYDFYLHEETEGANRIYENAKQFVLLSMLIVVITFLICLIMISIGTMAKLFREKKAYAIYSLLGYEKRNIFMFAAFEQVFTFFCANIIILLVFSFMYITEFDVGIFRFPVLATIFSLESLLLLVTVGLTVKIVNKEDLSSILREKE